MQPIVTILLVDDARANIEVLLRLLGSQYRLAVALSGQDAVERALIDPPDLILLDINMPDMDGFTVCRTLKGREETADIPIIFITGMDDEGSIEAAYEAGGVDYVVKPFKPRELQARVRTHLALRDSIEQLSRKNNELEAVIDRVRTLEGIIPICMYCKQIRDPEEHWHEIERYICEHSDALFSHGICPECLEKQLKELDEEG